MDQEKYLLLQFDGYLALQMSMMCTFQATGDAVQAMVINCMRCRERMRKDMLNDVEKINAIVWAAAKQGASYGEFSATLTGQKSEQVYKEYENYLGMKQKGEKSRIK